MPRRRGLAVMEPSASSARPESAPGSTAGDLTLPGDILHTREGTRAGSGLPKGRTGECRETKLEPMDRPSKNRSSCRKLQLLVALKVDLNEE